MAKVADAYDVVLQQYADDTQLYIAMFKMSSASATIELENFVTALHRWFFAENGPALNPEKSEAVQFSTAPPAKGRSGISNVDAAESTIALSNEIKLLGTMPTR